MTCLSIGPWARRAIRGLLAAWAVVLLSACGSGSVVSELKPARFITVGDSFMDVGQNGALYTVNDTTPNWIQQMTAQLASRYGVGVQLKSVVGGGWGYAQGYARVDTPGADPSVKQQVDALLAATTLASNDVIFVNGGMHDVVAAVQAGGGIGAMTVAVEAAADALALQVRRLLGGGAQHIMVMELYNLGSTPWAQGPGLTVSANDIKGLSLAFNDRLLLKLADLGGNPLRVLMFDPSVFFNAVHDRTQISTAITDVATPVCTTPDALTCTPVTVASGDYNSYLFADKLHFTPLAQRHFVDEGISVTLNYNPYLRFSSVW